MIKFSQIKKNKRHNGPPFLDPHLTVGVFFITMSNMKRKETIETERLVLRKFNINDAEAMFSNWTSDPEVTKFLTWSVHENLETTKMILNLWVKEYQDPTTIRYGITLKDTGELVGGIDVVHYYEGSPVVGYCISRKCWNKGYMTECFRAFSDYLFSLGFKKILIEAEALNIGSNRVIQKNGFKLAGNRYQEPGHKLVNCYELENILETDRLVLREMADSDYKSLQAVISDPETMKYYPEPYNEAGVQKWIDWCKASQAKRGFSLWSVILKETGQMIGDCGISMQTIDDELKPEIGYHLNKKYHRQGIGKEMTQAVRDYFFTRFNYEEVYSYMDVNNIPSYKTAEANDMTYLHDYQTESGEFCRVYRITRDEWKKIKK